MVVAETSDVEQTLELEFSNFSADVPPYVIDTFNVPPIIILCTVTQCCQIYFCCYEKKISVVAWILGIIIHLEGLRKTTKNLRIAGLSAKIWTQDLPNTKQGWWGPMWKIILNAISGSHGGEYEDDRQPSGM
jgi:hypothetical protein